MQTLSRVEHRTTNGPQRTTKEAEATHNAHAMGQIRRCATYGRALPEATAAVNLNLDLNRHSLSKCIGCPWVNAIRQCDVRVLRRRRATGRCGYWAQQRDGTPRSHKQQTVGHNIEVTEVATPVTTGPANKSAYAAKWCVIRTPPAAA